MSLGGVWLGRRQDVPFTLPTRTGFGFAHLGGPLDPHSVPELVAKDLTLLCAGTAHPEGAAPGCIPEERKC